jgi:mRNA interferase RelE/StbE
LEFIFKYHRSVKDDLDKLDNYSKSRIKRVMEAKLLIDPINTGELLKGNLKGFRKLKVGDYRIVYKVSEKEIHILGIRHRKDIYSVLENRKEYRN